MAGAFSPLPLRSWLLKKPDWPDHQTVAALIFALKTFAAASQRSMSRSLASARIFRIRDCGRAPCHNGNVIHGGSIRGNNAPVTTGSANASMFFGHGTHNRVNLSAAYYLPSCSTS
jgi:hypothetical protein